MLNEVYNFAKEKFPNYQYLTSGKDNVVFKYKNNILKINLSSDKEVRLLNHLKKKNPQYIYGFKTSIIKHKNKKYPIILAPYMEPLSNKYKTKEIYEILSMIEDSRDNYENTLKKIKDFYERNIDKNKISFQSLKNLINTIYQLKEDNIYLEDIIPHNLGYNSLKKEYQLIDFGDYN